MKRAITTSVRLKANLFTDNLPMSAKEPLDRKSFKEANLQTQLLERQEKALKFPSMNLSVQKWSVKLL